METRPWEVEIESPRASFKRTTRKSHSPSVMIGKPEDVCLDSKWKKNLRMYKYGPSLPCMGSYLELMLPKQRKS